MLDIRKLINSTDFLEKLKEQIPKDLHEEWDKYVENEIEKCEKIATKAVKEMNKPPKGNENVDES